MKKRKKRKKKKKKKKKVRSCVASGGLWRKALHKKDTCIGLVGTGRFLLAVSPYPLTNSVALSHPYPAARRHPPPATLPGG